MIDALTGETNIEEPVVSIKSGNVYEKRVIEKYLRDNGKGPSIDEELQSSDLIALKVNKIVKPRPPAATSIPGMLQLFQNEWDALMLESFTLKQQLDSVRQELAHALYQHDAACRVIARLMKERDEARNQLANFKATAKEDQSSESMEVDTPSLSEEIVDQISKKNKELTTQRKKRTVPEALSTPENIKAYKSTANTGIHSASPPGILTIDVHPQQQDLILSGGADHNVVLFNRNTKKVLSTMKGHTKSVNQVKFHATEKVFVSASSDKTARVWVSKGTDQYENTQTIKHNGDVTGVDFHPIGGYFVSGSSDSTWSFNEISSGETLIKADAEGAINFLEFHPDGALLGTGVNNILKMWDIRTSKVAASFEGHTANLTDMSYSGNGFYVSTIAEDNSMKLWDLRQLKCIDTADLGKNFSASSVEFDSTGSYVAATGKEIKIYSVKKNFEDLTTLSGHTEVVTSFKWGNNAQWFVTASMDRSLRFWSK